MMTSLETTGKDIAGLEYPAVTICGQVQTASFSLKIIFYLEGYDLSGLEDAVEKRFDEWLVGRAGRRKRGTETREELFIKFSDEVFGIKDPK